MDYFSLNEGKWLSHFIMEYCSFCENSSLHPDDIMLNIVICDLLIINKTANIIEFPVKEIQEKISNLIETVAKGMKKREENSSKTPLLNKEAKGIIQ